MSRFDPIYTISEIKEKRKGQGFFDNMNNFIYLNHDGDRELFKYFSKKFNIYEILLNGHNSNVNCDFLFDDDIFNEINWSDIFVIKYINTKHPILRMIIERLFGNINDKNKLLSIITKFINKISEEPIEQQNWLDFIKYMIFSSFANQYYDELDFLLCDNHLLDNPPYPVFSEFYDITKTIYKSFNIHNPSPFISSGNSWTDIDDYPDENFYNEKLVNILKKIFDKIGGRWKIKTTRPLQSKNPINIEILKYLGVSNLDISSIIKNLNFLDNSYLDILALLNLSVDEIKEKYFSSCMDNITFMSRYFSEFLSEYDKDKRNCVFCLIDDIACIIGMTDELFSTLCYYLDKYKDDKFKYFPHQLFNLLSKDEEKFTNDIFLHFIIGNVSSYRRISHIEEYLIETKSTSLKILQSIFLAIKDNDEKLRRLYSFFRENKNFDISTKIVFFIPIYQSLLNNNIKIDIDYLFLKKDLPKVKKAIKEKII